MDPRSVRLLSAAAVHCILATVAGSASAPTNIWKAHNVVFLLLEIVAFLALQTSNPGYVVVETDSLQPSSDSQPFADDEGSTTLVALRWSRRAWRNGAGIHDRIPVAPQELRCWCEVCQISPPLRSHHCSICNKCVSQYDRHEFTCGCVGERNRFRYFVWLIGTTGLVGSLLSDLLRAHDWQLSPSLLTFIHDNFVFILVATVFWSVWLFFAFSLFGVTVLMATNLTLIEITKHRHQFPYLTGYGVCDLPFNLGLVRNVWHFVRSDGCFHRHGWVPEVVAPPGERQDEDADCATSPWSNRYYACC